MWRGTRAHGRCAGPAPVYVGDQTRGETLQPSFAVKDQRVLPNICYENNFGDEIEARLRASGVTPALAIDHEGHDLGVTISVGWAAWAGWLTR